MPKRILVPVCLALLTACSQHGGDNSAAPTGDDSLTVEVMLRTTPVLDQGDSDMCWLYAMLATIETEHIMRGDSIHLSPAYVARQFLAEQARAQYASGGEHRVNRRGMMTLTPRLLDLYGAMPYTSYRGYDNISYDALTAQLQRTADRCLAQHTGIARLDDDTQQILETTIGPAPLWVFMLGCQYTPREFAHSVCRPGEYVALTSFTHHPFGAPCVLEVPDNTAHDIFINVPLDSMMHYVEHALRSGHPVCWEGDITDDGFDAEGGNARLTGTPSKVTQQQRQHDFDEGATTDDHNMAIVGIARSKDGRKHFICKNSWGDNARRGFIMMDENYARLRTVAVMMAAEALPAADHFAAMQPTPLDDLPDIGY